MSKKLCFLYLLVFAPPAFSSEGGKELFEKQSFRNQLSENSSERKVFGKSEKDEEWKVMKDRRLSSKKNKKNRHKKRSEF